MICGIHGISGQHQSVQEATEFVAWFAALFWLMLLLF
jgi:hypothetical protein